MGRSKDIASGAKFVDVTGDTMTGDLAVNAEVGIGRSPTSTYKLDVHGEVNNNWLAHIHNTHATGGYGVKIRAGDDNNVTAFRVSSQDNSTTILDASGSGVVTKPNQPAWRIGRGSNYTITNGQAANTVINFNVTSDTTRRFFTQGGITVSSGVVTVPVTGVYNVGAGIRMDGIGGGYAIVAIRINNDTDSGTGTYNIKGPSGFSSSYQTWSESTIFKLNANDQVKVYFYVQTDTSFSVNSRSYFHGYLLG